MKGTEKMICGGISSRLDVMFFDREGYSFHKTQRSPDKFPHCSMLLFLIKDAGFVEVFYFVVFKINMLGSTKVGDGAW
jgi:hypothetical protein